MYRLRYIILLSCLAAGTGCSKNDPTGNDCQELVAALAANDKNQVADELDHLLVSYSRANVERLALQVGSGCSISATLVCFDCIQTNPRASEIRLSFTHSNAAKVKFLEIAPDISNRMKVLAIRD